MTFRIDHTVSPFTAFSTAQYGTGSDWFASDRKMMDGINGLNATWGESAKLPNNTVRVQNDQAHFSLRLPQTGVIGDRVWNDANGNGIQDAGEAGISGVKVELLDENGQPVLDANGNPITTTTDANGAYNFQDLPLGKYKLRFSGAPAGMSPTVPAAGDDRTKDSDINAAGETGTLDLNSDTPEQNDIDAGYSAGPTATDDQSLNNDQGTAVKVPVLSNDKGDLDPSTVKLKDPNGNPVDSLTVAGEGKWTVDPKTGDVTFTPEAGFTKNPTPVNYTVKDENGQETGAKVTVTYKPEATDDESLNNKQGTTVTVPALKNDKGDLDPSTVKFKDPNGNPVDSLTVAGEGKWTVEPKTGDITFTPEAGFTGNPTPVNYIVKDHAGNETGAKVTITYAEMPVAADDQSLNNDQGTAVKVPVLSNDKGDLDPSTVKLKDPNGNPVDSWTVAGEGKWTVDPQTGDITFAPEAGFTGNPTPVNYTVKDKNGNETGAKVTVTYKPEAADDESLNNDQGTTVTVPTLKNDKGDLDPSTVKLKDPNGNPVDSLTVVGEGKWTVDPKTGDITFAPEAGFTGNPTPVNYTVKDKNGQETGAKVTVTYKPEATDDQSLNNPQGTAVKVPVLANDKGDLDPSTVKLKDANGNPVDSLTVAGEGKWTVDPKTGDITFTPEAGFTGNPTPVNYTVKDKNGQETGAKVTVTYKPEATDDQSLNNPQGTAVKVPVLANDKGDLDPSTVKLKDANGNPVDSLTVAGEGKWTVDPKTGDITFAPEAGFTGNPTPVNYTVKDKNGNETGAKVTVTYKPEATDDESLNNDQGTTVTVPTLKNDKGDLDPSTVKLKDPNGNPVDSLTVVGEGKWTVDPKTGDITFAPEAGFTGNPTPVNYTVKDKNGQETGAKVTVTYKPEATDDQSLNNPQGTAVKVPVLANDKGDLDPSTVKLKDANGNPVDSLTVAGEGKWTVDPKTGDITFTPEAGFTGNPTPVNYTVKDKNGQETGAKVTVTYKPEATDDQSLNNPQGTAVKVPVLANDKGDLDPSTVKLKDANGNPVDSLTVAGEGKWTVDPKTGDITFTPEAGFTGNPTPVNYTVKDHAGNETGAKVTVTYKPEATDDQSLNNDQGTAVKVPVLANDKGDLDPSTVKLKDKDGNPVDSLTVPGEGKWTVDPKTGDVTFAPEAGFTGNPTPVNYTVKDKNGQETGAKVTVTYKPEATDDQSLNNKPATAVKVPVLGNDKGDLDPSTVKITDKNGKPVSELVVPGQGKWTVDPKTGDIIFTPEKGFTGNPTPVNYTVKDRNGNETGAKVTVTYSPETPVAPKAKDDESLDNQPGTAVTVPVVGNDEGNLDPSTVKIIDPRTGTPVDKLVVPGEGTWTVNSKTGDITFTPEKGFTGNPTPIEYLIKDKNGKETRAKVTVTYQSTKPGVPGDPAPANPAPGGDLAYTGANIGFGTIAAGALLFLGGAALLIFRRRRQH
ncbi:Ig-like domain-containing protein [Arthrobacter woluwensis]|uniref:Ig-like domain-containing protein n=1 Tax=Arthrobacter woluwensis TaxID=156980 RepID=UPI0027D81B31|nr:SdrD B-like domain-containing protein [Arthrobacter woluwensis]